MEFRPSALVLSRRRHIMFVELQDLFFVPDRLWTLSSSCPSVPELCASLLSALSSVTALGEKSVWLMLITVAAGTWRSHDIEVLIPAHCSAGHFTDCIMVRCDWWCGLEFAPVFYKSVITSSSVLSVRALLNPDVRAAGFLSSRLFWNVYSRWRDLFYNL